MKIGPLEAAVILVVFLLIFGPSKLPGLAKAIGKSVREFKGSLHAKPADEQSSASPPEKQSQQS